MHYQRKHLKLFSNDYQCHSSAFFCDHIAFSTEINDLDMGSFIDIVVRKRLHYLYLFKL